MSTPSHRCVTCGLSKDPKRPDFRHVRIGLDEPPEPLLCKCKNSSEMVKAMMDKLAIMNKFVVNGNRTVSGRVTQPNIDPVIISQMVARPKVEVEMRMSGRMSHNTYTMMSDGFVGHVEKSNISESGCSWWTGTESNMIAKMRTRSNGEMIAKVPVHTCEIMPGITIAVSHEYEFSGEIVYPEYTTEMHQLSTEIEIAGVPVILTSRKYVCEDAVSYSSEVEFEHGVVHQTVRKVVNECLRVFGSEASLAHRIDRSYMSEVMHADHDVVDVMDLDPYRGSFMLKADGMKGYVFSYSNGYVVTLANRDLTIISYVVPERLSYLVEITNKPDVLVVELLMDGRMVYIDSLTRDGVVLDSTRPYSLRPVAHGELPPMIFRRVWGKHDPMMRRSISSMPFDGVVCVTDFRTLRLKEPTIDLMFMDGFLHMSDSGTMVKVIRGTDKMKEGAVYEMRVVKSNNPGEVVLMGATKRLVKKRPNNSDIVKRAFMSACGDKDINTILYDITSMSFSMRKRVYETAQSTAHSSRRVIVVFGAGRLQEINEMKVSDYSYIVIDPEIDVSSLSRKMSRMRVTPYDTTSAFDKQIMSMTGRGGNVMYYKGKSEEFIMMGDVASSMSRMMIPAVFSFSVSYHVSVINMLANMGVKTVGCGFLHDDMPASGCRSGPVTMKIIEVGQSSHEVEAKFGKSVWLEPILLSNSVKGMKLVRDVMPELWNTVDSATSEIMSRAFVMS